MAKKLSISWIGVLLPILLHAQLDSIDVFMMRNLKRHHIPGASLIVIHNHKIIWKAGYGHSNIEHNVYAKAETVYEIGSITKQFTAMAIMLLVESGSLDLDHTIDKYFKECPAFWKKIRIKHLLTHTSGIRNHVAILGFMNAFKTNLMYEGFPATTEILKMFYGLQKEFEPGDSWSYDNTGYYLLGLIIEQVSGMSYWDFLRQKIFTPLQMSKTGSTNARLIVPNRASGYLWIDGTYYNQPVLHSFIGFSAGSIVSTVEDLARWDEALYTEKLVKRSTLDAIWKETFSSSGEPLPYSYGYGWFLESYKGKRIHQHSGGTPGFSSVYLA